MSRETMHVITIILLPPRSRSPHLRGTGARRYRGGSAFVSADYVSVARLHLKRDPVRTGHPVA